MSEEIFLVLDFNAVCRFCLRSNGALNDLFLQEEGLSVSIPAQIQSLMDIQINLGDGFPDKLCHRCRFKIEICYEFKEMVLRTHKVLTENSEEILSENVEELLYSQISRKDTKLEDLGEKPAVNDQIEHIDIAACDTQHESGSFLSTKESNILTALKNKSLNCAQKQSSYIELTNNSTAKTRVKSKKSDEYPSLLTARRRNQCLLCLEKCLNQDVLKEHIQNHILGTGLDPYYLFGERNLTCKICDKIFKYRYNFITHQREHLDLKPFVCNHPNCNSAYSSVYRLRNHLLIHADKKFPCSYCSMKFQRKSDLRVHEIIHIDEGRKFQCSICKLDCKNRRTLGAHMRKHYSTPRFKCETCSKAYLHRSELERHIHIHSSEKRFRCSMCTCAYYSRTALIRHEKNHIQSNSPLKKICPLRMCSCKDSKFDSWQKYNDHMDSHPATDYPYSCVNCNCGFVTHASFSKHMTLNCPSLLPDISIIEQQIQHNEEREGPSSFVQLIQLEDVNEHSNIEDVFTTSHKSQE